MNWLKALIQEIAELRFEIIIESKARRYPYRVYDRIAEKTIGQFDDVTKANDFKVSMIKTFVLEKQNDLPAEAKLLLYADGRNLPSLSGQSA